MSKRKTKDQLIRQIKLQMSQFDTFELESNDLEESDLEELVQIMASLIPVSPKNSARKERKLNEDILEGIFQEESEELSLDLDQIVDFESGEEEKVYPCQVK